MHVQSCLILEPIILFLYNIRFHTYMYGNQSVHFNLLDILGRQRGSSKLRLGVLLTGSNYEAFITALKHGLVDRAICDSEENVNVSVLLIEQDLEWVLISLLLITTAYHYSMYILRRFHEKQLKH